MEALPLSGNLKIATECCVIYKDKVLVQRRPKDAKNFPNFITFPGGHVDFDEDLLTAAKREVLEESGIDLTNTKVELKVSCINNHKDRDQIWISFAFKAVLEEFQEAVSTKEGECEWMNIDELSKRDDIFPPIKFYFNHIFSDSNGIVYLSSDWEKTQLIKVTSKSQQ
jgi:8-oxo-dGTP pyrophosphatase MutT (NUDIX family)